MPFGDINENGIGFQRYIICEGTGQKCGDRYDLFNDEKRMQGRKIISGYSVGKVSSGWYPLSFFICEKPEKQCGKEMETYDWFCDEKEIAGEIVVGLFYKGTAPR